MAEAQFKNPTSSTQVPWSFSLQPAAHLVANSKSSLINANPIQSLRALGILCEGIDKPKYMQEALLLHYKYKYGRRGFPTGA